MKPMLTLLLASTALTVGIAGTAAAQTAPPASTPAETGDPVADAKPATQDQIGTDPAAASDKRDDDIVVTGTRIIRPNNRSAAPITSTTSADIAAQGALTIEEVLNRLPQVAPNAEQNYADSDGRQRVKLRNLGFERTLSLIDGLRMGVGIAAGIDTSIIPTALVERVDVLTGGASSVYGSDAISGVINYVLKKNFDGINITGNYSFYNHDNNSTAVTAAARATGFPAKLGMTNDGGRADVTLTAGKTLFDGALNVTGFVNYRHSDIIRLADRSYSSCEALQPTRDGPLTCSRASFTPVGTIIPQSGANSGRQLVNNPNGSGTFVPINSIPGTSANPYDGFSSQREFNRINAGGFVTLKLADAVELYSNTLWYRDRSRNPQLNRTFAFSAYGSAPYQVNCNNPFLSASQAQTICGAAAGTAALAPIDVRYRFDNAAPLDNRYENTGVRIVGGARGRVLDDAWSYDIAGVYARSIGISTGQTFADFGRVNRSLNVVNRNGTPTCASVIDGTDPACVPFNAFAPYNSSAALQQYLFTGSDGSLKSNTRMWQALATVSGDLGKYGITSPLAEQGVAVAFSGEFRDEKFVSTADAQYRLENGGTDALAQQNVWEASTEIQVPLIEKQSWTDLLQVNGGYRISKYNRLENTFSTWKVEGLWAPIEDITFRGSFNKAQRAPNVVEVVQATNINYTVIGSRNDPCATSPTGGPTATLVQCRATGLPDALYGSAALSCPDQSCTIRNGGFGLTPETAYTKTFGVIVRPRFLPGLTLSVDRYLIDLNDSIGYFAANDFLSGCLLTLNDYYCRGVVRNPTTGTLSSAPSSNPTSGYIAQGTTNGYKSKAYGFDFQAQYQLGIGSLGSLNFDFNGTRTTRASAQDRPEIAERNCAGYYGPTCGEGTPKWVHTLRTTWQSPDRVVNISLNWRYTGPMTITYNAEPGLGIPYTAADRRSTYYRIDDYNYFDLSTSFDIAKQFSLRLSVNNLFDKDPPLIPDSRSTLGLLRNNTVFRYDLLGRQIVAGASVRF